MPLFRSTLYLSLTLTQTVSRHSTLASSSVIWTHGLPAKYSCEAMRLNNHNMQRYETILSLRLQSTQMRGSEAYKSLEACLKFPFWESWHEIVRSVLSSPSFFLLHLTGFRSFKRGMELEFFYKIRFHCPRERILVTLRTPAVFVIG